jgi:hypothetical protein
VYAPRDSVRAQRRRRRALEARELTRTDLSRLIDRGLQETRGSYRALLGVFGFPQTD